MNLHTRRRTWTKVRLTRGTMVLPKSARKKRKTWSRLLRHALRWMVEESVRPTGSRQLVHILARVVGREEIVIFPSVPSGDLRVLNAVAGDIAPRCLTHHIATVTLPTLVLPVNRSIVREHRTARAGEAAQCKKARRCAFANLVGMASSAKSPYATEDVAITGSVWATTALRHACATQGTRGPLASSCAIRRAWWARASVPCRRTGPCASAIAEPISRLAGRTVRSSPAAPTAARTVSATRWAASASAISVGTDPHARIWLALFLRTAAATGNASWGAMGSSHAPATRASRGRAAR
mmetsp:Transcript_30132/g.84169  ORF Transcript_30132/g.84169 Transcript_30132/m.84169 type:complete len:296 (+) Transcript_30132:2676-3563(+)